MSKFAYCVLSNGITDRSIDTVVLAMRQQSKLNRDLLAVSMLLGFAAFMLHKENKKLKKQLREKEEKTDGCEDDKE